MNAPSVKPTSRWSAVWIVPIAALVIAIWTLVQNILAQGPEIRITFPTAAGLVAGQTSVKVLDVEIGRVEEVLLSEGYDSVIAVAKLAPNTAQLLREDSQFWVVRPRIGSQGISGLSTLLSGAYIELAPGSGAAGKREYAGLDNPPLTAAGTPGLQFKLLSDGASSVHVGSPVLYNGYAVGRIESTELDESGKTVLTAFVDAPYDDLITTATRFWDASGVAVDMDGEGFSVRTESLEAIVTGGVAFSFPEGNNFGRDVENGVLFFLYGDQSSAMKHPHLFAEEYVLLFDNSVRGLLPDAPVEYRGMRVGTVTRVGPEDAPPEMVWSENGEAIPVIINLEPGWLGDDTEESTEALASALDAAVARGLRASLAVGNLLTGNLFVSLDFAQDAEPVEPSTYNSTPVLPTVSTGLSQIENKVVALLNKLQGLPLEETLVATNAALASVQSSLLEAGDALKTVDQLLQEDGTQALPGELTNTLQEVQTLLQSLSSDAPLRKELVASLQQLQETLTGANALIGNLERQPNSLIFGSQTPSDPIPGGDDER